MANTQGDGGSNAAIVAIFVIALIVVALVIIFVVHPFGGSTTIINPSGSAAPSASVATSVKTSTSP
jgi:hypothetical protein